MNIDLSIPTDSWAGRLGSTEDKPAVCGMPKWAALMVFSVGAILAAAVIL